MTTARACTECGSSLTDTEPGPVCAACARRIASAATLVRDTSAPTPVSETTCLPPEPAVSPISLRGLPRPGEGFGPYRVLRELGSGGMGSVFEAEETDTGRRVALKVLSHAIDSIEMRKRFLREGRLAASVNHPNSVYVYGTEEIDGMPSISMELLPGGTLADRVIDRGPLPVGEAVDAVLQMISGLEAAQRVGVLHRDIKPTNCFIDGDGTVKVGDFGLSVSVASRVETQLTTQGTFLGTPTYSSPEQLRGDDLDLRSDIYSVGATLYYLLTARVPFDAENMVKLIALVLERTPEPPTTYRAGIPRGLSRAILRCLEKQPEKRYASYEDLRRALVPYASASPTAATLGLRLVAGLLDIAAMSIPLSGIQLLMWGADSAYERIQTASTTKLLLQSALSFTVMAAYFALQEAWLGGSLGKLICRLRVVRNDRGAIGLWRAVARALLFLVLPAIPSIVHTVTRTPRVALEDYSGVTGAAVGSSYYLLLALLFATGRRRNGFAALHDLLTGVRVVRPTVAETRPVQQVEGPAPAPVPASRIGPYEVVGALGTTEEGEWLLAADPRLGRRVWIRRTPAGTAPPRTVARQGRLRWLNGRRTGDAPWDAFEYPGGAPLLSLIERPRDWASVRYWMADLANELAAAAKDGSLPGVLALDRVWISGEGRAKVLDFPAPQGPPAAGPKIVSGDDAAATRFLAQVALSALEGRAVEATEVVGRAPARPLPMHARAWVGALASTPLAEVVASVEPLLRRPAAVTWRRRLAIAGSCLLIPVLFTGCAAAGLGMNYYFAKTYPDVLPLAACMERIERIEADAEKSREDQARDRRPYEVYIASRLRRSVEDPAVWSSMYVRSILPAKRQTRLERILAENPSPTEEEIHSADAVVGPIVDRLRARETYLPSGAQGAAQLGAIFWMAVVFAVGLPSLVWALLARRGPVARWTGVDYARTDGTPASRGRAALRQLLTWSPLLLPLVSMATGEGNEGAILLATAAALLLGATAAVASSRSIQDRIAGTWVVPA